MKILVCIKQVPDRESRFKPNAEGVWYDEADLAWRMNEYDEYAVEQAVLLKEQLGCEPELTVLSIGPDRVREVIQKALAMGCDFGVHVQDPAALRKDPWQIASIIAAYAKGRDFDLIFTGMQSEDGGSAQVGVTVAELLGYVSTTTVVGFDYADGTITAKRELEGGIKGVVKLKTPAVLTCESGLNVPRYPTLPNILKTRNKEIQAVPVSALLEDGPLLITSMFYPPFKNSRGIVLDGDVAAMADRLVRILKQKTPVLR
jgi:electron transfer flavoprotein beta subunit